MKFSGLVLWVVENRVSEKFYRRLGFDIVETNDRHTIARLGSLEITLVNMRDEEVFKNDGMVGHKGKGVYVYILVDDVDAQYAEFKRAGIQPATEPKDWDWGNREFIVKDPDGYKLCFWQEVKGNG